ncbi:hypothetical protein NMG60_11026424 [Bertholletia excelsa]
MSKSILLGNNLVGKTHYDNLGVRGDATYGEIRTSYGSAILNSHSGKLHKAFETSLCDQESRCRFLKVQRAWEILSNSKLHAAYDEATEHIGLEGLTVEKSGDVLELVYQCRCGGYSIYVGMTTCAAFMGSFSLKVRLLINEETKLQTSDHL